MSSRVYFAFHNAVLHYDCVACQAGCCRGQGMGGVTTSEISPLISRYPSLTLFTTKVTDQEVHFKTPTGRCFFLQDDHPCKIEVETSRQHKPKVCKLFPFNNFRILGETLIVAPHFMCPLSLEPSSSSVAGTYDALEEEYKPYNLLTGHQEIHLSLTQSPNHWLTEETQWRSNTEAAVTAPEHAKEWVKAWLDGTSDAPIGLTSTTQLDKVPDKLFQIFLAIGPSIRLDLSHLPNEEREQALRIIFIQLAQTCLETEWIPSLQGLHSLAQSLIPKYEWLSYTPEQIHSAITRKETQPISDELQESPHEQLSFGILLSYLQQGQTPAQSLKSIENQFPGPIEYHAFISKVGRLLRSELIIATGKQEHSPST